LNIRLLLNGLSAWPHYIVIIIRSEDRNGSVSERERGNKPNVVFAALSLN
jgi:hypothetical protein